MGNTKHNFMGNTKHNFMEKKILVLENDYQLSEEKQPYVFMFLENYKGEVIDFCKFKSKTKEEIISAVASATDIITQTCFVQGSDVQFESMVYLLSKFPVSKNIYIGYLGGSLYDYIDRNLEDKELVAIEQHKIFEIGYFEDGFEVRPIDFSDRINRYKNKLLSEQNYRDTAQQRLTGQKIKILACNASGKAFNGLSIGATVDVLDMSKQDENTSRGVWIWGNGEPIKLVNDCGLQEYELAGTIDVDNLIEEIIRSTDLRTVKLKRIEVEGLFSIIQDEEISSIELANYICEETGIAKRGNRQKIVQLISQYREQLVTA